LAFQQEKFSRGAQTPLREKVVARKVEQKRKQRNEKNPSDRVAPQCGSSGQRPYSLQPGVERPKNAQRFGRATPGSRTQLFTKVEPHVAPQRERWDN
jgi:hypothetical protein